MQNYKRTQIAAYMAYVVQAIVNTLSPLLFVIFQDRFHISYTAISLLVLINFLTQLIVDISSTVFVDKIGYRRCLIISHLLSGTGLILLSVLPFCMSAFAGLIIATVVMAVGSGLIEVLVSPLIENLPLKSKAAQMSLLHSFFCWGQMAVVIATTLFLHFVKIWHLIPILWALIPLCNAISFISVPIVEPPKEKSRSVKALLKNKTFLLLILLMLCGGAAECAMGQWSSLFAQKALGLPKLWGDLSGPCGFALCMALGRVFYGRKGGRLNIHRVLSWCAALCVLCYLAAALAPSPILALAGCILCGLSVSLMWPGCFSLSAHTLQDHGTAMFALLAMGGDLGCSVGPWLTGVTSDLSLPWSISGLKFGLLCASVFPITLWIGLTVLKKRCKK